MLQCAIRISMVIFDHLSLLSLSLYIRVSISDTKRKLLQSFQLDQTPLCITKLKWIPKMDLDKYKDFDSNETIYHSFPTVSVLYFKCTYPS